RRRLHHRADPKCGWGPARVSSPIPQRVVITGLGALSPGGVGVAAYGAWLSRPAAQRPMRLPEFNPASYIANPKLLRSMHRSFQLVVAAAVLALRQAGLPTGESLAAGTVLPERAGIAAALADLSPLTHNLL